MSAAAAGGTTGEAKTAAAQAARAMVPVYTARELGVVQARIENAFVFALVWTFGATSDAAGREIFDTTLR